VDADLLTALPGGRTFHEVTDGLFPDVDAVLRAARDTPILLGCYSEEEAVLATQADTQAEEPLDPFWFPITAVLNPGLLDVTLASAYRWHRARGTIAVLDEGDERLMMHLAALHLVAVRTPEVFAVRLSQRGIDGQFRLGVAAVGDVALHDVVDDRRGERTVAVQPAERSVESVLALLDPQACAALDVDPVFGRGSQDFAAPIAELDATAAQIGEVRACDGVSGRLSRLVARTWTTPDGLALLRAVPEGWELGGADETVLHSLAGGLVGGGGP
jgi:hypothetical protein